MPTRFTDEQIDQLREVFLTKEDAKTFATKKDIERFATKQDLENFATKDDLKGLAAKDDLKPLVTNAHLHKELERYTAKDELNIILQKIIVMFDGVHRSIQDLSDSMTEKFSTLQTAVDASLKSHKEWKQEMIVLSKSHYRLRNTLVRKQVVTEDEVSLTGDA